MTKTIKIDGVTIDEQFNDVGEIVYKSYTAYITSSFTISLEMDFVRKYKSIGFHNKWSDDASMTIDDAALLVLTQSIAMLARMASVTNVDDSAVWSDTVGAMTRTAITEQVGTI